MKKFIIVIIVGIALGGAGAWYFLRDKGPVELVAFNFDPGEYFVTDIKNSNRLLKTDIIIHAADDTLLPTFTENSHKIRDIIIFTLREKTGDQLQSSTIQQELRDEIIKKLNVEFETDTFQTLYFNEFVIQ